MTALSNEEVNAIACIPGALFEAHAGCTSSATARFKEPRKQLKNVPILDPAIGVAAIRDRFQKDPCHGNARAAKLLQRLIFRYLPNENGKARLKTYRYESFWWEKSYEDWAAELDITGKQVRTDFANLKKWGLAEARPMKVYEGKNAGKTVIHARVIAADGAASLSGWPDYPQMRTILGCPNGHPIAMPKRASHSNAQMVIHKAKEEVTQKGKVKEEVKTTSVPTQPGTPNTGVSSSKGYVKTVPVKTKPDDSDLLPEKYLKASALKKVRQPAKIIQLWEKLYNERFPELPFVAPTQEVCKNFNHAMQVKVRKAIGGDPAAFVEYVFAEDSKLFWRMKVKTHGAVELNSHPAIEQIVLHLPLVIECFIEHRDAPLIEAKQYAEQAAKQAAKDAAYEAMKKAKAEKDKDKAALVGKKMTVEEMLAIEAEAMAKAIADAEALDSKPTPPAPIEMAANASMTSHAVADLLVTPQPEPVAVPTLEDADCFSLDPNMTLTPWTAEQGKAWFAEQLAKKAAEAKSIEQKKSKPKQPAKPFHLCNVA